MGQKLEFELGGSFDPYPHGNYSYQRILQYYHPGLSYGQKTIFPLFSGFQIFNFRFALWATFFKQNCSNLHMLCLLRCTWAWKKIFWKKSKMKFFVVWGLKNNFFKKRRPQSVRKKFFSPKSENIGPEKVFSEKSRHAFFRRQ